MKEGLLTVSAGGADAAQRGETERKFSDAASTSLFLLELELVFLVSLLRVLLTLQVVAVGEVRVALALLASHESRQSRFCQTAVQPSPSLCSAFSGRPNKK